MSISNSPHDLPKQKRSEKSSVALPSTATHKSHLALRTHVHAGGPACGYQCLAYRKCLGDNDDWAAIRCDM